MKVLVLGCGRIGSVAAEDLAKSRTMDSIVVADKNGKEAEDVVHRIGENNLSWMQLDATDHNTLIDALEDFDLVMGFLPGKLGYPLTRACIRAGTDLVDVSYMSQNPLSMNKEAVHASTRIVPDCGLAPGISNILVGHVTERLDSVSTVHIMVGGLPERPTPPLDYIITWSPDNLIEEYVRKAKVIQEGEIVEVEALTGLEEVEFPDIGTLEAFYTDGLRTLPYTIRNINNMWEKTLRYPGHAKKIELLRTLGFFDEEPIDLGETSISPRSITARLFTRKLCRREVNDIVAMKIKVLGVEDNIQVSYTFRLLDRYDKSAGVTAMARTTAYPASIVAQMILKGTVEQTGVIPPERLGMDEQLYKMFMYELERRGIMIDQKVSR